MGRSIFIVLLILVILVSISPQTQTKITSGWESVRPAVVESMDILYAAVHDFVAGTDVHHQIQENPETPPVNFDVIITMKSALPF
jgi:hypothetical protein